jgi:putative protease
MDKTIEVLAPAGSYEGMKAAFNAGADAVYIGGSSFGARAYANNPEDDILLTAIDEAHLRGKKLYLTVNTLLKEKEHTGKLYQFLEKFYLRGLDAVIVQDVGVLHFIHRSFPDLPVHASTQMTLTMAQGANLLENYGVTRLVTPRELSLKEISILRENTKLEIETFVHGALCYCYSGQCLMSSMIGGRSGNRGRCAQPCRMPYQFYSGNQKLSSEQEKYLLSPKDMNTIGLIPELIEAGIDSFKIEGRMKRPEYAAAVSGMYRKYVDLCYELGKERYIRYLQGEDYKKDILMLQDVYNRGGFSEGYGRTYHGKGMMSLYRPNHSGVLVGEVALVKGNQVTLQLQEDINAQDILEIRYKEEEGYEFTVKDAHSTGERLVTNVGRRPEAKESREQDKNIRAKEPRIKVGDKVYRTRNNMLMEQLRADYLEKDRQLGMEGNLKARLNEPLSLTVACMGVTATSYHQIVQEAMKQPMTQEKLSASILKTGDTFYYFDRLTIDMDENIFVPVGWLNELRRNAIDRLQEELLNKQRRTMSDASTPKDITSDASTPKDIAIYVSTSEDTTNERNSCNQISSDVIGNANSKDTVPGVCACTQTVEQFEQALQFREVTQLYVDYSTHEYSMLSVLAKKAADLGKEFYISLPPIVRYPEYENLKSNLAHLLTIDAISGFLVKNFEEIALLQSLGWNEKQKKVILNYNMYTYNQEAKSFFRELGIEHYTAPVELNYQELRELGIKDSDMIVYGYQPVTISAQCLFESTQGCKKCKQGNRGRLVDRIGKGFHVQTDCNGCYNIIYNTQVLSLLKQKEEIKRLAPRNIRLDFTLETKEETKKILAAFLAVFYHGEKNVTGPEDYTTGHFKRGVE